MYRIKEVFDPSTLDALYEETGIRRPQGCEDYIGVYNEMERLLGCAGLRGNVLVGFAVKREAQGLGLMSLLCQELIRRGVANRQETMYVFTKPGNTALFVSCGFRVIAGTAKAALLQWGVDAVSRAADSFRQAAASRPGGAACIVMNANPFTLGHLYLVERAAMENPWVYVLVVEEEASEFPFTQRQRLVRQGTSHLPNVSVLPSGRYVISQLTFPTYFIKDQLVIEQAQMELDLDLFGRWVAPALGVSRRYVGAEPSCPTTARYNETMKRILPGYGIQVVELARRKSSGGGWISASEVRKLLNAGDVQGVRRLVPPTTYQALFPCTGSGKNREEEKDGDYQSGCCRLAGIK